MRIPSSAPSLDLLQSIFKSRDPKVIRALMSVKPTDYKGRYLHWDQLKYRPAPEGLTVSQHWLATKFARGMITQPLPLTDKDNEIFKFAVPDTLQRMLHEIDRHLSGHIGIAEPVVNPASRDMYLVRSLVEEAIASSQLEGASTTRKVAKGMLLEKRKPRDRSEKMILNNYLAMQFVQDIQEDELTPEIICELQRIVTEGTLDNPDGAGKFRTEDDITVATEDGIILHTPPPASALSKRIEVLCDFANQHDGDTFIHPVIRAILLHFMLAYDHPFVDGNGRTARALFYWSMAKQGYWLAEHILISRIIRNAPAKYGYAFLYSETDDNDVTYFLAHQLDVIQRAITDLHLYLEKKVREFKEATHLLENTNLLGELNHRQIQILEHALKNPGTVYRFKEHQSLHNISYPTARTDLLEMSDTLGLLLRIRKGRSFAFIAPSDLKDRIAKF